MEFRENDINGKTLQRPIQLLCPSQMKSILTARGTGAARGSKVPYQYLMLINLRYECENKMKLKLTVTLKLKSHSDNANQ